MVTILSWEDELNHQLSKCTEILQDVVGQYG